MIIFFYLIYVNVRVISLKVDFGFRKVRESRNVRNAEGSGDLVPDRPHPTVVTTRATSTEFTVPDQCCQIYAGKTFQFIGDEILTTSRNVAKLDCLCRLGF